MPFSYSIFRKCELKNFPIIPASCQRNRMQGVMELAEFVRGKRHYILKHLNSLQFWTESRNLNSIKKYIIAS